MYYKDSYNGKTQQNNYVLIISYPKANTDKIAYINCGCNDFYFKKYVNIKRTKILKVCHICL